MRRVFFAISLSAIAAPLVAAPTPLSQPAGNTSLSFTSGVDFSSGDYGLNQKTKITVVPLLGRLTTGDFAFTASMPYIWLNSPGGVVLGPDGQPIPGVPSAGGKVNGFGDLTLGGKYTAPSSLVGDVDLTVGGRVKLPTADKSKGLSTGKTDFAATLEAGYTFGKISPFVEVGYRWLGDPSTIDLRNGPTLSAGTSVELGKSVLIASYDYVRSATPATTKDSHELFAGLAAPVGKRLTLTGYGTKGLSQGAPDYGVGMLLTVKAF